MRGLVESRLGIQWRNVARTSIGCACRAVATEGVSACFGVAHRGNWANSCAKPLKVFLALYGSKAYHSVRLGWANREAAWSISRLTNGLRRHIEEAVCSLPPSLSSVWLAMRCSKQHSSPHLRVSWVHLSRNWHPLKHDVPHIPPRTGRRHPAPAYLWFAAHGGVRC